jgi:nitroreductase
MAALNMCYAATEQGLGSCVVGLFDRDKLRKSFGIPEDRTIWLILALGYPAKETAPKPKVRKPLEEICSFNTWE